MILRIFATDGFTPERIFRWSVEETALRLCEQQILWVTRLDGPWKPLVDWFLKQPCCRAVVLDHADRWDWHAEHEITWRIAQGLYFNSGAGRGEGPVEAVCWLHDDMAPPSGQGFKDYLKRWLKSESTALEGQAYQLWDRFDSIRADGIGIGLAGDCHCGLTKWRADLRWGGPSGPDDAPSLFRPLNSVKPYTSPWPFRHAKGVDRDFREGKSFVRKGFLNRWPSVVNGVRCVPYRPDATWEEFKREVGT